MLQHCGGRPPKPVELRAEELGRVGRVLIPSTRAIAIYADPRLDPFSAERSSTLAHEAAPYLANHRGKIARDDAETVAESTAFVVMDHFGVNTGQSTFAYVAGWAKDTAVLQRNLGWTPTTSSRGNHGRSPTQSS